jgi:hypothetical protein
MFIHIYLELILELKSSNASMINKHQNNNFDYGDKPSLEIKTYFFHIPLKLHVLQLYNGPHLFLFSKYIPPKNCPMFYSLSNGDKNYVI